MHAEGVGMRGQRLRVLFASAEAFPLAKTGGLGDVCAALPDALARLGVDIRIMLPGYPQALDLAGPLRCVASLPDGGRVLLGRMPDTGVPVYLFDRPELFRRAGGLYQDADKRDWPDNDFRFGTFCRAVAHIALHGGEPRWWPDVVHANDWHTGLVPGLLRSDRPLGRDERPVRSIFTIHNLAYQGNFPLTAGSDLALPPELLSAEGGEFYGQLSFMKAGISQGDRITTVSPNYAREILTPEHGVGLDGVLRGRAADLVGILNGVDHAVWDPGADQHLSHRYSGDDLAGKAACKAAIQQRLGLDQCSDSPLVCFFNRLTHQKMADVVLEALPHLVDHGAQFVLVGEGDRELEHGFARAASGKPSRVAVQIGYQEIFAHQLNAAADISLTPSRFEPCGLTAMYSMRYGTLPVARAVGGLVDTVVDIACARAGHLGATGFTFAEPDVGGLMSGIRRACAAFRDKVGWRALQRNAMERDFGWEGSARQYLALARGLLSVEQRGEIWTGTSAAEAA
jgi:starch synthase